MPRILTSTLLVLSLAACGGTVDIRPENVRGDVSDAVREEGERRYDALLEAHGGIAPWNQIESVRTTFRDEWTNWLFFQITPYAENNQLASLTARPHTFPDARIEFLEGKGKGEVWTTHGDRVSRERNGEVDETRAWDDSFFAVFVQNPEFMIGTPFRLASADQFAHVGPRPWRGIDHDVILLSWGTLEPQETLDQWMLYVDPTSGRLAAAEFTVRMSGQSQTGFYHFHDYRTTDGLVLAHAMDAYLDKDDDEPLHRYRFDDFAFSPRSGPDGAATVP